MAFSIPKIGGGRAMAVLPGALKSGYYDFKVKAIGGLFQQLAPGKTAKVEIQFDPVLLSSEIAKLQIGREETDGSWTTITEGRTIDLSNHTISAYTGHMSKFAAFEVATATVTPVTPGSAFKTYAFPNPCVVSPTVAKASIRINLPAVTPAATVEAEIKIYTIAGELVQTLTPAAVASGNQLDVDWLLTNKDGAKVASGVYIYQVKLTDSYVSAAGIGKADLIKKIAVVR
jgi:hypothetical protein